MPLTLKCKEQGCGQDFVVEDGEIAFLQGKFGDDYKPPQRCKPCRDAKKARMGQQGGNQSAPAPSQNTSPRDDMGNEGGSRPKKGKKNRGRRGDGYSDY